MDPRSSVASIGTLSTPSSSSSSSAAAVAAAGAPSHVVPFGAIPGSQPGALSFGFGLSAASHMSSHSQQPLTSTLGTGAAYTGGWGHAASAAWGQAATTQHQQHAAIRANNTATSVPASSAVASSSRRRRRRSLSMEDDEAQDAVMDQTRPSPRSVAAPPPPSARGIKKARLTSTSNVYATPEPTTADLGKALASLSKESLLSLLNKLVSTSPQLVPTIEALLPPPTLSHSIETIHHLERAVAAALPGGQNLRDEYVFGRVRVPLEQFVADCKSFLAAFCSPATRVSSTSTLEYEIGHPSTTFAFLFALTSSLRRLELALPSTRSQVLSTTSDPMNPIASHLLPLTINQWHVWLTRLSTGVNHEGRMLAATTLRTWFAKLDELCVDSPGVGLVLGGRQEGVAKRAMEGVRERLRKEVGWVIGWRDAGAVGNAVGGGMDAESRTIDDEEEL
ncbi:BQ2448_3962 [Microbotryum intermedium]|uniref:Tethering factor for nuclear proteasome STS1 n=1 Tax=Microbotryum intermedium TaxID=269621 RepID=A0A238FGW5_9BASI|nr:BQ2448_3962 [Microbotryum intermedium]